MAQQYGVTVNCVNLRKPSLEDVFLHFTGRTIREQEGSQSDRNRAMVMRQGRRHP
jgi:ABC-2 type transport system ATP-binding protein